MKRVLQLYVIAISAHIILAVIFYSTERLPVESNGFADPGIFSWFVFPLVFLAERFLGPSKSGEFYGIAFLCNTLVWAAVVLAIALGCRVAFSSSRGTRSI